MGTCASVDKNPESAVRFRLVVGTKKVYAPTPRSEGLAAGGFDQKSRRVDASPGFRSPAFGGKDETFFDSRAWLESDCEDDFFSVNGDFTPSGGSTPNYQTGTAMKPQLDKALSFELFPDTKSEPSPRKKLAELFKETASEPAENESKFVEGKLLVNGIVKETNTDQIPKPFDEDPCLSQTDTCSGASVSKSDFTDGTEERERAMPCCLPSLVHSHFSERKKQTQIPEPHTSG